jgi:hypothetical protein
VKMKSMKMFLAKLRDEFRELCRLIQSRLSGALFVGSMLKGKRFFPGQGIPGDVQGFEMTGT